MENKANETIVEGRKFRRINVSPTPWESIAANTKFIDWKIKYNIMIRQMTRRKPNIVGRRKNTMDDFVMTKKYSNFDGCIITDEIILSNGTETDIKAEWDTGVAYSCISNELVNKLGLKPIKTVLLETSDGQIQSNVYTINLVLNKDLQISIDVNSEVGIEDKGIQCLIGMDVISLGNFAISNYNGKTCFSFRYPSKGLIDFTEE